MVKSHQTGAKDRWFLSTSNRGPVIVDVLFANVTSRRTTASGEVLELAPGSSCAFSLRHGRRRTGYVFVAAPGSWSLPAVSTPAVLLASVVGRMQMKRLR